MILITGGKYQGRLKCALEISDYTGDDVFDFAKLDSIEYVSKNIDYKNKKVWYNLQEYVRSLANNEIESVQIEMMVKKIVANCNPEIIIVAEVGAGVIPMNKKDNLFREASGRLSAFYAGEADEVYRVICGLKTKLK